MSSSKLLPLLLLLLLLPSHSLATSISATPLILTKSGRTITIRWSGIQSPSDLDWLGIYSPSNSPDDHFIGYRFLNGSETWRSGSGSISIPLVNTRSDYQFRIFRWTRDEVNYRHHDHDHNPLPGTRHRLAGSAVVQFENPSAPDQVHLALTDRVGEMRVLFVTGKRLEAVVEYGSDSGLTVGRRVAATAVTRYERSDMCDSPANSSLGWRDPGFIHDGLMTGLNPGKRYYYRVGSDVIGWSDIYSFVSPDSNETIAFMFGDMGAYTPYSTFYRTQDESKATVKWILRDIEALGDKPALVSHIGDISYARGFSWIWDEFFNQIEPIASRLPYHVCIGNHEYDWPSQPWRPYWAYGVYGTDGGGECGVPYSLKFRMPGNSSFPTGTQAPDTKNLYYSFDAGVVHFLYISTETNFLKGSDQYNFIKADLESVDREKTPFIVVQGHRPMYTTSNEIRDAPMRERLLESLEPLLVDNNVTLALWGHVHRYERFCPLKNYTCVDYSSNSTAWGAPVHVVIGMAGQDWQPIWEPRPDHPDVPIFPQPERSMYRGGEFGYTRLVATREKLTLTYIGNHDGEMHDMVEIPSGIVVAKDEGNIQVKAGEVAVPVESSQSLYLKAGGILILGLFIGFALGFTTRCRRDAVPVTRNTWTPVKNEEI
ncbi:Phosphodiesterase I protein [Dioscorea alata]|uniref:Phosphodiesterase I protein n=1 Tax=Dioscorea alata TaxID=55571 RepID=A0ACB7UJM3_DIOAL|nr:Phosphodiesterase I protein [Dioscorea alata]